MSIQLSVFIITPYVVDNEVPLLVAAVGIEEAIAIAVAYGLESFAIEGASETELLGVKQRLKPLTDRPLMTSETKRRFTCPQRSPLKD